MEAKMEDAEERARASQRARSATYRLRHTEKIKESKKIYYVANVEQRRKYAKDYRTEHSEDIRLAGKEYYASNIEKFKQWRKNYRASHSDIENATNNARRARLSTLPSERVLVSVLFERDKGICGICQKPVSKEADDPFMRPSHDHILPVSYGGANTYANSRLTHRRCNIARGNRGEAQLCLL